MIPIFRKIRKKMADDNRPLKYIRYAIGEILLVVIGILIALSINNWNENRKRQNEELILLADVKNNLEMTLTSFRSDTIYNANTIVQYHKIENYIDNDLPYSIELDSVFGILTFWNGPTITASAYNSLQSKGLDLIKNEAASAYNSLQSKGLDLIKNEALKQDIINMYDEVLKELFTDYENAESKLSELIVDPFFVKHVKRLNNKSLNLARPNDFESLKKNQEFSNILSAIIRQRKKGIIYYAVVMNQIETLIDKIKNEIDLRNNK